MKNIFFALMCIIVRNAFAVSYIQESSNGLPPWKSVILSKIVNVRGPANTPPTLGLSDSTKQYLVGPFGSGVFSSHKNSIATWTGSYWVYDTAYPGMSVMGYDGQQYILKNDWVYGFYYSSDFSIQFSNTIKVGSVKDYSGSGVWELSYSGLTIKTDLTGTNYVSTLIPKTGDANFTSISTGSPNASGVRVQRISSDGVFTGSSYHISALNSAPDSATATCVTGDIRWTADYVYLCAAPNTWRRAALLNW